MSDDVPVMPPLARDQVKTQLRVMWSLKGSPTPGLIKKTTPASWRHWLRGRHRDYVLRRGLRRVGSGQTWDDLVYGWSNGHWSAFPEYLEAVASYGRSAAGPVLECGSGLTTLLLASLGAEVYALEHDPLWRERLAAKLAKLALSANVIAAPLRSYGAFDWYDVDVAALPMFSLVVCDGPPGDTRGGRYGLIPVMRERLSDGCTILMDDLHRPGEQEVLESWGTSLVSYRTYGKAEQYAIAVLAEDSKTDAQRLFRNTGPGKRLRSLVQVSDEVLARDVEAAADLRMLLE